MLRAIFSESPIGIVILTKEGRILSANRSFRNLCSQSSVRDMNLSQLIISEDLDAYSTVFDRMSTGKTDAFSTELRYRSFEHSQRWIRMTLYPVDAVRRNIVVGFFEDVTVQKEREAELRRQKETSRKAQEAAEKETRVKSDFLANMSHEIRTPIHTITGMSELLGETKLDPEQQEYVDQIEFSADVLLSLINDVLDFSKIEAGKLSLEKIEFDLQKMAEDAVDLVALEAHKKGLDTGVFVENNVATQLLGDPVRLRQIIVNLFNNAVKFTQEGEVVITVSKEEEYANSVLLKFCVHDTGIGIPEEKKNKLFKIFSQVDSSTTRKYGGTGLGLSISKNLAELMQGRIGVESREGRGSTFWFTAHLEKQGKPDFFATLPANYFQQRVLVVDDNTRLRGYLRHYLEQWGCRVEECSDGPTALERLKEANAAGEDFD
ncbi:MAG: ATP-binding protein, partial [Spirochaetota bacterium]|nr:ATP-binding protein [Spirochaetota bacterium]